MSAALRGATAEPAKSPGPSCSERFPRGGVSPRVAELYGRNRGITSLLGRPEPLLRGRGILLKPLAQTPLGIQRRLCTPLLKLSGLPCIALPRQLTIEFGALGARLLLGTVSTVDRVLRAHLGPLGAPLVSRALARDALAVLPRSERVLLGPSSTRTGRGPRRARTRLRPIDGVGWRFRPPRPVPAWRDAREAC